MVMTHDFESCNLRSIRSASFLDILHGQIDDFHLVTTNSRYVSPLPALLPPLPMNPTSFPARASVSHVMKSMLCVCQWHFLFLCCGDVNHRGISSRLCVHASFIPIPFSHETFRACTNNGSMAKLVTALGLSPSAFGLAGSSPAGVNGPLAQ